MSIREYFRRRRPLRTALARWLERHQDPFNFWIHMLGIPLTLVGLVLLFALPWEQWYLGVGVFVAGYLLQWIGHLVEGNDMGEIVGIKRLLGLPYVAIAPRFQSEPSKPPDAVNS